MIPLYLDLEQLWNSDRLHYSFTVVKQTTGHTERRPLYQWEITNQDLLRHVQVKLLHVQVSCFQMYTLGCK